MPKPKGLPKTGGRKKGSKNKLTRDIKEVINELLSCMNKKEIKAIYNTVKKKKPEVLINFIGKIAPKDLNVTADENMIELIRIAHEKRKKAVE